MKRNFGLTTADESHAHDFADLALQLFGVYREHASGTTGAGACSSTPRRSPTSSSTGFGLTDGPSAREKKIPDAILRSPEPVVRAFLRAYFDCDGYAGKQGVILSTASEELAEQVQLLLLNFGILSRRRRQKDDCWHVHVMGESARRFAEEIGFGLARKQKALDAVRGRTAAGSSAREWDDEVVSLEHGRADVYDISVEETHRYAARGFINHNSYWHSKMMTDEGR